MNVVDVIAGAALAVVGGLAVYTATAQRRAAGGAVAWLEHEIGAGGAGPIDEAVSIRRLAHTGLRALAAAVGERTPAAALDRLHAQLLKAGLATSISAEEFLSVNILTAAGSVAAALLWLATARPSPRLGLIGVVVLGVVGVCVPRAWLSRRVDARGDAIFKALPDALDLMVIAMEAGVGFDGAIQVVAEHLGGPLADELLRTLAEMELGLPRREALQNLRRRAEVPELSHVVISLLQADALGMPVARVLRVQAGEMRTKRRQWAREKAGKLPVKILLPLVLFIFPPVMVVVIGPAAHDIMKIF